MSGWLTRGDSTPNLRFGTFEFDREQLLLFERGRPVHLQQMPLEVLSLLLENPGKIVTQEEFYRRLWSSDELGVIEDNLYTAISKLRRTLRDRPRHSRFIETVPRKGYRFIASVAESNGSKAVNTSQSATARWQRYLDFRIIYAVAAVMVAGSVLWYLHWSDDSDPVLDVDPDTVVVLPFENLGNADEVYFSNGLTDELIATLSQMNGVSVVSRTSSFAVAERDLDAREIGRLVGAGTLLEGSVRKADGRARVSAQLVDAATGTQHWSRTYERDMTDLFMIQQELALNISEALRTRVSPAERARLARRPTEDPDAYVDFLRGRYFWNQRSYAAMHKAIEYYERAIEADPEFAAAYAALANVFSPGTILGFFHPEQARERVEALVGRAMSLDPDHPEVLLAESARRLMDWEWKGSEHAYQRAIRAAPDSAWPRTWYAYLLHGAGRLEDAMAQLEVAARVDPLAPVPLSNKASVKIKRGRLDTAHELLIEALQIAPDNWVLLEKLRRIHEIRGDLEQAISLAERIAEMEDNSPRPKADLARLAARTGQEQRARGLLAELEAEAEANAIYYPSVAGVYAALDEFDQAFGWLERSYAQRHPRLAHLADGPRFEQLHDDPRFEELIEQIGFRAEWAHAEQ